MRKLLEHVVAYPLDCEVRLGSVFAALLASQDTDAPDAMAVCENPSRKTGAVGEPCTRCGNCRGWTRGERRYQNLANEYGFVTGQALLQFDMSGQDPASRDELHMLGRGGNYLDLAFGYAGYRYHSLDVATDRAAVFAEIRDSIDRGLPVLMQYEAEQLWLLVTGYGDDLTLYGYDGGSYADYYRKMLPSPDGYEGKLFRSTNWVDAVRRVVIVEGPCAPTISLDDVIARNASLMQPIFDGDFYGRAVDYLLNDDHFRDDGANLRTQAKLIDDFIGVPIGGRSIVSWFLFDQLAGNCEQRRRQMFARVAGCCCDIHEICWVAWRGVGCYEREPARFWTKLADPLYRKMLAGVVALVGYKDRHVHEALRDYANAGRASGA